ncbi:MAG: hypothetical protein IT428_31740 [Planctomycetaceae bacterium]|nr:hypothetical protein [Planctomycetaceae bacterium]
MSELLVRSSLANFPETNCQQSGNNLMGLEHRQFRHDSDDLERLCSDKLRVELRLALFQKHLDHFGKVLLQLIE